MHGVPSSPRRTTLLPYGTTYTVFGQEGVSYEMGVYFTVDVPCFVLGVRWFKSSAATVSSGHVVRLWNPSGVQIASAAQVIETSGGWQEQAFADPYPITPGGIYCVSRNVEVAANDPYAATNAFYASPFNAPPIHAPINAGRYVATPGTYPTSTANSFDFGVDPVLLV